MALPVVCTLCGEDGREVIRLVAEDTGTGVGEVRHPWQLSNSAVTSDTDRVAEEVAWEILLQVIARVQIPILLGNPVNVGMFGCCPRLGLPSRQAVVAQAIEMQHARTLPGVVAA